MTTFEWKLVAVTVKDSESYVGVLKDVGWSLTGTRGEHSHTVHGTERLGPALDEEFIPLEELDEQTVISWAHDVIGESGMGNILQSVEDALDDMEYPPLVLVLTPTDPEPADEVV